MFYSITSDCVTKTTVRVDRVSNTMKSLQNVSFLAIGSLEDMRPSLVIKMLNKDLFNESSNQLP